MTIEQAKLMLDTLKKDFKEAWAKGNTGNIDIDTYKVMFNVSDKDIKAYCATLTPIQLKYPKCILCGNNDWFSSNYIEEIKPINNGHIIYGVDMVDRFCANESHPNDTIWYNQESDGNCSFTREIEDLHGNDFMLRYNCGCMEPKCFRKNVIYNYAYVQGYGSYPDKIIKVFPQSLPLDISREEIWKQIEHLIILL